MLAYYDLTISIFQGYKGMKVYLRITMLLMLSMGMICRGGEKQSIRVEWEMPPRCSPLALPRIQDLKEELRRTGYRLVIAIHPKNPDESKGQTISRDLYIINADGTGLKRLTNTPHKDEYMPRTSPNGKYFTHNQGKYLVDVKTLKTVFKGKLRRDWSKVYDKLLAGHLLASNQPHDLTSMVLIYLNKNIKPFDDDLAEACHKARAIAKKDFPDWRIASVDLPEMPSAKGKVWKFDSWLPRAITKEIFDAPKGWRTICSAYANKDSQSTLALFKKQRELLKKRGLWKIYLERLKLLPIVYQMEDYGVTLSRNRLEELRVDYLAESSAASSICRNIATGYDYELALPKSGNNNSLLEFVFGPLGLKSHKSSKKTGKPSMDKTVLEEWEATLPKRSKALAFVRALKGKRKRDTALNYLEGYERFWLPLGKLPPIVAEVQKAFAEYGHRVVPDITWYRLHPSLNPTGTDTLRWSSSNPNEQNISKQEGFNLRYCFGPAPGREWWSLDAKNIELRLPAYEAGETEMITLFENPNEPPYYGSYHLLVFDTLHPDKFAKHGKECKKVYESTWYQWTKNGNFAVQYGAVEASGTADRAYHVKGAQKRIQQRFRKIKKLNEKLIAQAQKTGYVETMPDKTVDPKRGYPLLCSRTRQNRVLPTVPLNYWSQGTAMWWMMKAMIRCQAYLNEINGRIGEKHYKQGFHMIMQVHDELVFDFPKSIKASKPKNLAVVRKIQKLMEQGGDDIGVPTPVSIEYHPNNWSEGVSI